MLAGGGYGLSRDARNATLPQPGEQRQQPSFPEVDGAGLPVCADGGDAGAHRGGLGELPGMAMKAIRAPTSKTPAMT